MGATLSEIGAYLRSARAGRVRAGRVRQFHTDSTR